VGHLFPAAAAIGFGLAERNFFTFKNFSNILYYATTYALLAAERPSSSSPEASTFRSAS